MSAKFTYLSRLAGSCHTKWFIEEKHGEVDRIETNDERITFRSRKMRHLLKEISFLDRLSNLSLEIDNTNQGTKWHKVWCRNDKASTNRILAIILYRRAIPVCQKIVTKSLAPSKISKILMNWKYYRVLRDLSENEEAKNVRMKARNYTQKLLGFERWVNMNDISSLQEKLCTKLLEEFSLYLQKNDESRVNLQIFPVINVPF